MATVELREAYPGELRELDADRRARFVEAVACQLRAQLGLDPAIMTKALPRGAEIRGLNELAERVFQSFEARHKRLVDDVIQIVRGGR